MPDLKNAKFYLSAHDCKKLIRHVAPPYRLSVYHFSLDR